MSDSTVWLRHAMPQEAPLSQTRTPDPEPALLSEEVAATRCGVSRPTFRRWAAANCVQPVPVAGAERRRLYRREDIEVFIRSR